MAAFRRKYSNCAFGIERESRPEFDIEMKAKYGPSASCTKIPAKNKNVFKFIPTVPDSPSAGSAMFHNIHPAKKNEIPHTKRKKSVDGPCAWLILRPDGLYQFILELVIVVPIELPQKGSNFFGIFGHGFPNKESLYEICGVYVLEGTPLYCRVGRLQF